MAEAATSEQVTAPTEEVVETFKFRGRPPTLEGLGKTLSELESLVSKSASGLSQTRITQANDKAQKALFHFTRYNEQGSDVGDSVGRINSVIDSLASIVVLPGEEKPKRKPAKKRAKKLSDEEMAIRKVHQIRGERESLQRRLAECDTREAKALAALGEIRVNAQA